MNEPTDIDRKLQQRLLVRGVDGDRLMLADAVLQAALDGSRPLTANERHALQQSPLTARRLRQLALEARRAANDSAWQGSHGMLRAAASAAPLASLSTDDGYWSLHFVAGGAGQGERWQLILKLAAEAPFAARLLREQPLLRVKDGAGGILLQGHLDSDGECETAWPFASAPAEHFQQYGALFAVTPAQD